MTFPALKTGALAQYPLQSSTRFSNQAVRFLDGSRQRFPLLAGGLRRWMIRLELLDEAELAAPVAFADDQQNAVFAFTDPITNAPAANCVLSCDRFEAMMTAEQRAAARAVIEEI